ncbi:MAG TPA: HAMP domain-containing histidine kinase [Clostridiaceae bacterium]|nr:HAMP domain-containing histidine kinase [Clostridiaceae bacterium]
MMNKLTHNFFVKISAVFLIVVSILVFIYSSAGIYLLNEYGFHSRSAEDIRNEVFENITKGYANTVFYSYYPARVLESFNLSGYQNTFSQKNTNFFFVLKDSKGNILLSNYSNEEYQYSRTYTFEYDFNFPYYVLPDDWDKSNMFIIDCYVSKTLKADDQYRLADFWIDAVYSLRFAMIPIAVVSFLSAIILFIFLMCSAGRRKGMEGITPSGIDKIPFDIFLSGIFIILYAEFELIGNSSFIKPTYAIVFLTAIGIIDILLVLQTFMTFATRFKMGGLWKNTLIYRVLRSVFIITGKIFSGIRYLFVNLPLVLKTTLLIFAVTVVELIVLASDPGQRYLGVLWLLEKMIIVPVILFIVIGLRKLQTGGEKIAAGDLGYSVDTRYLFWDLKSHGENLNSISSGMAKAVEARMKSERLKTELITNVSHDLKTPLTSIINYVDLIKKEDVESDTLKEYISVLDHQTARLKKLTEDLIEASKASTGNVEVSLVRTEAGLFLDQIMGEYQEKINSYDIDLILKKPENEVYIMADGRLLWRVFDNLMNNICKYAQPSTRAYINLDTENNEAVITFRNISKFPLNISSDELLERFIRGDSSRNTEGSGLGLSIAKSLTELQNGRLDLYVDGDLFKVVLRFNTVQ